MMQEFKSIVGKTFVQMPQFSSSKEIPDKFKIISVEGKRYGNIEIIANWLNKNGKQISLYFTYEEMIDLAIEGKTLSENCRYKNIML